MSLGVDLVPHKTCNLDCLYCECGATTRPVVERDSYVPLSEVREEVESALSAYEELLDHVTLSGAGEPSLHSGMGELLGWGSARVCGGRC
jgi:wyosine [tRNA(Phe)-imidazoG37] synthetase (radical SAM superfamily)